MNKPSKYKVQKNNILTFFMNNRKLKGTKTDVSQKPQALFTNKKRMSIFPQKTNICKGFIDIRLESKGVFYRYKNIIDRLKK